MRDFDDNGMTASKVDPKNGDPAASTYQARKPLIPADYIAPLSDLLKHTVVMILCLVSMWLIKLVLRLLLGPNARFFDLIPVRYVIDVSDVAIIGKFVWEIIRG